MESHDAIRRVRDLPEWPDDWAEPEGPYQIKVTPFGPYDIATRQVFHDPVAAEWFAHWLGTKHAWAAFGDFLDMKR